MSSIELRHLRYFLAAAEHGSFRKAGIALAVQESSVSRRVRDLEFRLGALLFQRHSGGVTLTKAGQSFLRETRMALKHLSNGASDVGAIGRGETGYLRIGIFSSLAAGFLRDLFKFYNADHYGVGIDFIDGDPAEHIAAIRMQELDVAFVTGTVRHAGCETTRLWEEQIFVVLPSDHVLAGRDVLLWGDLASEKFIVSEQAPGGEIHDFLIKRLSDLGRSPDVRRQNVRHDNLMSLVSLGRGLTLINQAATSTTYPSLVYRPLAGETLPFSAIWSAKNDNPALRRLMSLARIRCDASETGKGHC